MSNRIGSNRIGSKRNSSTIPTALCAALAATALASTALAAGPAAVLPGGPAAVLPGAAAADDKCLAAPNAAPPPGSHWYYHLDRAQQQRCWYLGPQRAPVRHAETDAPPAAKSAAPASPTTEAPLPSQRPATAPQPTARADVETFVEPAHEEAPALVLSPEPYRLASASEPEAGSASLRQMASARGKAAPPSAASMLNAWAIFLILIASAGAVAGIIHHALFSPKAARPARARVKGGRAGRIASLGSERSPPTFAPRRPDSRQREPEEPIDLPNFEKEIQRIVWALESRAA